MKTLGATSGQSIHHLNRITEVRGEAERVAEAGLAEAEDVAHREPQEIDRARVEERRVARQPVAPVDGDVLVRERHALGVPARAARVKHEARLPERDGVHRALELARALRVARGADGERGRPADDLLVDLGERRSALVLRDESREDGARIERVVEQHDALDGRERLPRFEDAREQDGRVDEEDLRVAVLGDVARLRRGAGRVDRHHHAAGCLDGERGAHPLHAVRREHGAAIAGRHSDRREKERNAPDLRRELAPRDGAHAAALRGHEEARALGALGEAVEHGARRDAEIEEG